MWLCALRMLCMQVWSGRSPLVAFITKKNKNKTKWVCASGTHRSCGFSPVLCCNWEVSHVSKSQHVTLLCHPWRPMSIVCVCLCEKLLNLKWEETGHIPLCKPSLTVFHFLNCMSAPFHSDRTSLPVFNANSTLRPHQLTSHMHIYFFLNLPSQFLSPLPTVLSVFYLPFVSPPSNI